MYRETQPGKPHEKITPAVAGDRFDPGRLLPGRERHRLGRRPGLPGQRTARETLQPLCEIRQSAVRDRNRRDQGFGRGGRRFCYGAQNPAADRQAGRFAHHAIFQPADEPAADTAARAALGFRVGFPGTI